MANKDIEQRLSKLEAENALLKNEIDRLRSPAPRPEVSWPRELPGSGGLVGEDGTRVTGAFNAALATSGGGFGFGSGPAVKPLGPDRFRDPCGVIRDGQGQVVGGAEAVPTAIPQHDSRHQRDVALMDKWFPLHSPRPSEE